jgi:hypothetical protein
MGACVDITTDGKNCGACGHDCLGGGCQSSQCQPVTLATGVSEIAIDANNVYWTDGVTMVMQGPISGGTATTLATGQSNPIGIGVNATSVYWANDSISMSGGGSVVKIPIGGGMSTLLASGGNPGQLAVDGANVYWTDSLGHVVDKVATSGGTSVTLASTVTGAAPGDMAIDTNSVYWCTTTPPQEVRMVPKSGGSFVTLATGQPTASGVSVDATSVYWATTSTGEVRKVSIAGGTYTTLFSGQNNPHRTAIDGATIYWTSDGGIQRGSTAGGTVISVYSGATQDIKVDSIAIYFTTFGKKLMRLAK